MTPFSSFGRGRPWIWGLVGAYAAALLVSKATRGPETAPSAPADITMVTVPAVEGIRQSAAPVRLAFRDLRPRGASHRPPLVLVHGSPGSGDVFRGLTNRLGTGRRLLVPDLPGFGASSTRIPDYSFRSHARYLLELLDRLGVERAHLLGFSMGGGVVVQTAAQEPSRVAGVLVAQGRAGLGLALTAVAIGTAAAPRYRSNSRATIRAVAYAAAGTAAAAPAAPPLLDALQGWSAWAQAVLVIVLIAPAAWLLTMAASHRGRRLLLSSWRRLTRWEFWPIWAAYLPVAAYIVWLMVKHRGVTLVTAANPAIPGGGIVGESKFAILRGLAGSPANVAASALLEGYWPPGVKLARTEAFMRGHGLSLPVVLKPDAGQRGSGVVVIRTHDALVAALGAATVDTVVQEFVGGEEFGVFYCRRPSEPRGRILSITRKQLPTVRGDGVRSLERLILDDERAVCMARFHLRQQETRLAEIPPPGVVSLGDSASHCRGAIFLDGSALRSDALEDAVERVVAAFPGFYFGRFDLRASSASALREGRDFKILELNGVTSEPTHIYDPGVPIADAYRALFEQWRLAFAIGAENVARGAATASVGELARMAWRARREARHHLSACAGLLVPARAGSRRPQSAPQPADPA